MIYTVTFNPALDYVVTVNHFTPGRVNRTIRENIMKKGVFAHQWIQNLSFNFNQYGNSQTNNFQSKSFKGWQT